MRTWFKILKLTNLRKKTKKKYFSTCSQTAIAIRVRFKRWIKLSCLHLILLNLQVYAILQVYLNTDFPNWLCCWVSTWFPFISDFHSFLVHLWISPRLLIPTCCSIWNRSHLIIHPGFHQLFPPQCHPLGAKTLLKLWRIMQIYILLPSLKWR